MKGGPKHPCTISFPVREGPGILRGAIANGAGPKSFIVIVRFFDAAGQLIEPPYLKLGTSSLGSYRYLTGTESGVPVEFDIQLYAPKEARRVDFVFASWASHEPIAFERQPEIIGIMAKAGAPRSAGNNEAAARPKTPEQIVICEGDVKSGRIYALDLEIDASEGDGEKAYVVIAECLDSNGQAIQQRLPKWSFSDRVGNYEYTSFAPGEQTVKRSVLVIPPDNAEKYRIVARRWQSRNEISARCVGQEELLDHEAQVEFLSAATEAALARAAEQNQPVVLITATTRALESENRLNRPQVLALEFARQGFLTFYVYYRFHKTERLPNRSFENIIQLPTDILQILGPRIAKGKTRADCFAIFSIPDDSSVRQIGVFKRYGWHAIYEVRDDWEEFAAANVGKWYKPLWERYLSMTSDKVFTVSPTLRAKMVMFGCPADRAHLSANATTEAFVKTSEPYRQKRERSKLRNKRPVIGYFGHLTDAWFDWPLLLKAAALRPQWDFECIGFGAPAYLNLPDNLKIIDAIPQLELPEATKNWAIGTIPFTPSVLSRAVDPIKVYVYLSLRLPTLSVPMSRIAELDNVTIYEGIDDFLKKADAIIARLRKAPLTWTAPPDAHTWGARVTEMIAICSGASKPAREQRVAKVAEEISRKAPTKRDRKVGRALQKSA